MPSVAAGCLLARTAQRLGAQPYLARTADLRRAAERLLRDPDAASKRLNLREYRCAGSLPASPVRTSSSRSLFTWHGARFSQALSRFAAPAPAGCAESQSAQRLSALLRHAAHLRAMADSYFGPFASRRAAESFADGFLDLFKIRRCQIKIRRDPDFPGCIYSEMKMCLAPCFAGCTADEYDAEMAACWRRWTRRRRAYREA